MSIINKFLPKKESKEYFITLGVAEHHIVAAVAQISKNQVTIVGTGESEFITGENETEAADIAISTAEKNLPSGILVEKVIFGLPVVFLEKDKIKPEYLARLKKITKELALQPAGFVEYPQALAFYLEQKEESPPTLLLLSLGRNHLTFSLVRVGKVELNFIYTRTSSFTSDFEESLSRLTTEILPSRIVLYDEVKGLQMEELREELLCFPWHKHASFLHTPKIEILPPPALITALVEAAGSSILKEVELGEETKEEKKEVVEAKETRRAEEDVEEETFGFVKGEDITLKKSLPKKESEMLAETPTVTVPETAEEPAIKLIIKRLSFLEMPKFSFSLSKILDKSRFLFFLGMLGVTLAFIFSVLWYYPKATVKLIVYPLTSSQQLNVLFTTDPSRVTPASNIIVAKIVSEEVKREKTGQTSGKKKVGEPAKGSVVIYNKTTTGKTFPKGTILLHNALKFSLDEEINLASASDTGEGLIFGKASARITASEIGPEGNLPSGNNFTFKDFPTSSYYAKNTEKLSGGTSREISSVAKEDQEQLLSSLSEELKNQARQQILQKLTSEEKLLDEALESTILDKKFSKETGAEAKEINLSLSLKVSVPVFKETDLLELTKSKLPIPPGFVYASQKTRVKIEEIKTDKKGEIKALATLTAYFFPEIDKEKIKSDITGESFEVAGDYLSKIKHIGGVEIVYDSETPLLGNRLPWRSQNIQVLVVPR